MRVLVWGVKELQSRQRGDGNLCYCNAKQTQTQTQRQRASEWIRKGRHMAQVKVRLQLLFVRWKVNVKMLFVF